MKKYLIIFSVLIIFLPTNYLVADTIYFMDFTKVLNQSKAGKEAQDFLKKKLKNDNAKFGKRNSELKDAEKKLISKKKDINAEEYKKEINLLRSKVNKLQKDQRDSLNSVANLRKQGRQKLLAALNPIMKKYMSENNIKVIIDKKNVLLGEESLDITKDIINLLDKEIKTLTLK